MYWWFRRGKAENWIVASSRLKLGGESGVCRFQVGLGVADMVRLDDRKLLTKRIFLG